MATKRKKVRGQSMTPDKLRQIQELRRSNASGTIDKTATRASSKRRAIEDQE